MQEPARIPAILDDTGAFGMRCGALTSLLDRQLCKQCDKPTTTSSTWQHQSTFQQKAGMRGPHARRPKVFWNFSVQGFKGLSNAGAALSTT